ncbi:hypothetical protein HPB51_029634 [Rhipicephalus microplus]|uniref:Uncharacterized protein n=1 Tax=Rhipicephalus microplus TaxID=6941 RepID=A0A9J6CTX7_RHIMP|nr:hypothetical protein HPB51_029634 [Rhipicephalus microplus]
MAAGGFKRSAKRGEAALAIIKRTVGTEPRIEGTRHGGVRAAKLKGKLLKAGRVPRLPKEKAKVIVRPRGGLNIARMGYPMIASMLVHAPGITVNEAEGDTICLNGLQSIVTVNTPKKDNATLYVRTTIIELNSHKYEICAYEAAPHNP